MRHAELSLLSSYVGSRCVGSQGIYVNFGSGALPLHLLWVFGGLGSHWHGHWVWFPVVLAKTTGATGEIYE